jgi:hypothetical protein
MLKKTKLRALSPGQWARVRVPDYEIWKDPKNARGFCRTNPGDEVDICVMPRYAPKCDSRTMFHWMYQVAYRGPGSSWPNYESPRRCWISPWDFGLIDASTNSPNWDKATCDDHYAGKGKWLYEPASDDPELCPGGDWSRYECDICGKYVKPFSNDEGDLICPTCEVTGLVILDDEQLDRLEQVRDFARSIRLSEQLERQLGYLADYGRNGDRPSRQCVLSYDFALHSFSFAHYWLPDSTGDGKRQLWLNGGLIYSGPTSPGDGSFPALTVNLHNGIGWICHT